MKNASTCVLTVFFSALVAPIHASEMSLLIEPIPQVESPSIFWEQMCPEQQAALWPLLTQEQRLNHWRLMNKVERRALYESIEPFNRMRHRYIRNEAHGKAGKLQLTPEERVKMREQIRAVYRELKTGIPFECSDPRNCPREFIRIIDTHH